LSQDETFFSDNPPWLNFQGVFFPGHGRVQVFRKEFFPDTAVAGKKNPGHYGRRGFSQFQLCAGGVFAKGTLVTAPCGNPKR
jgi:hypothetical protein